MAFMVFIAMAISIIAVMAFIVMQVCITRRLLAERVLPSSSQMV